MKKVAERACKIRTQEDVRYLQDTLYVLNGKWKLPIIISMYNGNTRYRDIAKDVPGITFRMLSRELKAMELNKLVDRIEEEGPPKVVSYTLTDYSHSLYPLILEMVRWAREHRKVIV